MSIEIGAFEAKTKLPEILRRVSEGESFTITNRGKPIADLIPTRSSQEERVKDAISQIKSFRRLRITEAQYQAWQEYK